MINMKGGTRTQSKIGQDGALNDSQKLRCYDANIIGAVHVQESNGPDSGAVTKLGRLLLIWKLVRVES